MNPNLQARIADITGAIGTLITFIISLTHQQIRPMLVGIGVRARELGISGARLLRQLVDRHLVVFAVRPVLTASLASVAVSFSLGAYWLYKIGIPIGEAGYWFAGTALVVLVIGVVARGFAHRVRTLTDGVVVEMENESPTLRARRVFFDRAVAQHQVVVDLMETQYQQQLHAHQQACLVAAQTNPMNPAYPPAPTPPALPPAPVMPDLTLTTAQETAHQTWLGAEVLRRFGRPGLAPHLAMVTLMLWVVAGVWFIGVGVILRQFYAHELELAGIDIRMTSAFVGVGFVHLAVAMALWIAAAFLSAVTIRLGLGALVWGARLILPPTIQALPFWDVNNLNTILAPNLGVPTEELSQGIREAHELPFAIICAIGMLIITEHSFGYLGFLGGLAIVLLFGWAFIRGMKQSLSEKVVHGFVVGLFLLALLQLGLRVGGYSIVGVVTSGHAGLYVFAGANTYGMAGIFALLIGLVFFLVMVQYFIAQNVENSTMSMIMIGIVATIAISGSLVMAHRIARENPVHRTVSGSSGSSEHGEPARPPRSPSSGTTDLSLPTAPPASGRGRAGT